MRVLSVVSVVEGVRLVERVRRVEGVWDHVSPKAGFRPHLPSPTLDTMLLVYCI